MQSIDKRPGWHWTDYWRSGRSEVMTVQTRDGPQVLNTETVWQGYFASFPTGSQILDLATGSGQVAAYANSAGAAASKQFSITGVDYAELDTAGMATSGYILLGGVALERLPFAADSVDGASSQFGIEYADTRLALAELARVLKPGGRARMLIHHANSVITRQADEQIAAYDKVLGEGGAIRHGRRAYTAHLRNAPDAARRSAETGFRNAVSRASARLEPTPSYGSVRYLVQVLDDLAGRIAAYEPASALMRLGEFERGNAAWRQRQLSQTKAAMDEEAIKAFIQRASRTGLNLIELAEQNDLRGELIGWRVDFVQA